MHKCYTHIQLNIDIHMHILLCTHKYTNGHTLKFTHFTETHVHICSDTQYTCIMQHNAYACTNSCIQVHNIRLPAHPQRHASTGECHTNTYTYMSSCAHTHAAWHTGLSTHAHRPQPGTQSCPRGQGLCTEGHMFPCSCHSSCFSKHTGTHRSWEERRPWSTVSRPQPLHSNLSCISISISSWPQRPPASE